MVKIEEHGVVLIQKPTIDASLQSMIGAPVIIQHQDITENNADELRCGAISDAYFNDEDGWYYCEGVIWDKKAQKLIDKGWSVSCSYDFLGYDDEGGVENNIKYNKEFTKLNFTHLAIVNNPRYERANIVFNSKDDEKGRWVTIKGTHVFIPDGKSLDDVMEEKGWTKGHKDFGKAMSDLKNLADKANGVGKETPKERVGKAFGLAKKVTEGGKLTDDEKEWLEDDKQADKSDDVGKDGDKNMESYTEARERAEKQLEHVKSKLSDEISPSKRETLEGQKIHLEEAIDYYKRVEKEKSGEKETLKRSDINIDDLNKALDKHYEDDFITDEYTRDVSKAIGKDVSREDLYYAIDYAKGVASDKYNMSWTDDYDVKDVSKALIDKYSTSDKANGPREIDLQTLDREYPNLEGRGLSGKKIDKIAEKYGFSSDSHSYEGSYLNDDGDKACYAMVEDAGNGKYVLYYETADYGSYSGEEETKTFIVDSPEEGFKHASKLMKKDVKNKTNNEKEQDMALIRELKKLIKKVENNKGEQEMDEKEKVDNENVDKRKLIDEVGGILKGKVDEEVWRTVVGKLEKLSYDKSEAGSADNKKVKNEDDDKEVDNEDEKDEKEVAEVKEDVKEDVENKCKNSKSTFDKINAIYNSVKQLEQPKKFVSRQDKLDCAVEYFK